MDNDFSPRPRSVRPTQPQPQTQPQSEAAYQPQQVVLPPKQRRSFKTPLLILLALIVFGGSLYGVYFWQQQKVNEANDKAAKLQTQVASLQSEVIKLNQAAKKNADASKATTRISEEQNWLAYTSKDKSYSLRLPNGTEFIASSSSPSSIYTRSVIKPSTVKATVTEPAVDGSDNTVGLFVDYVDKAQDGQPRGEKQTSLKTYNEVAVDAYKFVQAQEPQGIDVPKGATEYTYYIPKGDKTLRVTYVFSGEGNVNLVEEMVKTIGLN